MKYIHSFSRQKSFQAFTLAEMVTVVTIIAILSTIGMLSYSSYTRESRDAQRKTDISNIHKVLDVFHIYAGKYPSVSDGQSINFEGTEVWKQGVFGQDSINETQKYIWGTQRSTL